MPPSALPPPPFWRTVYFDSEVLRRPDRHDIRIEEIAEGLRQPFHIAVQPDGRCAFGIMCRGRIAGSGS
jgi:hypothetical protein